MLTNEQAAALPKLMQWAAQDGTEMCVCFQNEGQTERHPILLTTRTGCVILGHYMLPKAWSKTDHDMDGAAIYEIPYSHIDDVITSKEAEVIVACEEADQRLLSYAQ